jgi:hypothetical protein
MRRVGILGAQPPHQKSRTFVRKIDPNPSCRLIPSDRTTCDFARMNGPTPLIGPSGLRSWCTDRSGQEIVQDSAFLLRMKGPALQQAARRGRITDGECKANDIEARREAAASPPGGRYRPSRFSKATTCGSSKPLRSQKIVMRESTDSSWSLHGRWANDR